MKANYKTKLVYFLITFLIWQTGFSQYRVIPQNGHSQTIVALEYSPDGRYLATGGHDSKLLLWDTRTGLHWPIYKHSHEIGGLSFSPDSKYLVSSDFYGNRYVWEVSTQKLIASLEKNNESDSGPTKFISNDEIAMKDGGFFKVWNFKTNQFTQKIPLSCTDFSLHPNLVDLLLIEKSSSYTNGQFIENFKTTLYNRETKTLINDQWIKSQGNRWSLGRFSTTGNYLLMVDNSQIVMFNYKSKSKLWSISLPGNYIYQCIITPDETKVLVAMGFENKNLIVYDLKTGNQIDQISNFSEFAIAYQPQNQLVAGSVDAGNYKYQINIHDLASKTTVDIYQPDKTQFYRVDWNDAEKKLYSSGSRGVVVWDLAMAVTTNESIGPELKGSDNELETIPQEYFDQIIQWKTGSITIRDKTYSPNRNYTALNVKNGDLNWNEIEVYENKSNRKLYTIKTPVMRLAFSRDEKKLFVTTVDNVTSYDVATGRMLTQKDYPTKSIWAVSTSFNGKYVAVSKFWNQYSKDPIKVQSADYDIDILDAETFSLVKILSGHNAQVTSMEFTPDNKYLFSASADGSIRIWDVASWQQKFLLTASSPNDYFIGTEEGYYSASKKALSKIAFGNSAGNLIPGELLEIQMNRPDKVAQAIGYSEDKIIKALQKAFEKRLSQLDMVEEKLNLDQLPQIKIISKIPPATLDVKYIEIEYEALDDYNKLSQLKLLINDVPIYGKAGIDIKNKNKAKGKLEIELTEGINAISIAAINEKGASSIPYTFNVFCRVKTKPNLYLITIGVDQFLDQSYNLDFAAKDATDIAAMFNARKADYGNISHLSFNGMQATKERILGAKNTLAGSKPDDQVVIFVATHGMFDENYNYYLATYNMLFDKPELQGLAYSELEGLLDGIPARKKLILIDACHSGEVDAGEVTVSNTALSKENNIKTRGFKSVKKTSSIGLENSFDLMKALFADLRDGTGATVISSAGGVEFALESDKWKNGVFTYALLEGIESKNADINYDALISVSELQEYVFERVNTLTNGKQNPTARTENLINDYTIVQTISNLASAYNLLGTWKAIAETDYKDEYYPLKPGEKGDIVISRDVAGFFRINYAPGDGYQLTPKGVNQYSTTTQDVVTAADAQTLIIKGTYSTIKYQKIQ